MWPLRVTATASVLASLFFATSARADDAAVRKAVRVAIDEDVANLNYGAAKKKLRGLLDKCKKPACAPPTLAEVHAALGIVASSVGQTEEVAKEFKEALTLDPQAALPSSSPST